MPSCSSIDPFVTRYIDGELGAAESGTLEQHLGVCPACRSRVVAERAARDVLRARKQALQSDGAPGSLRARCASLAADASRRPAPAALQPPPRLWPLGPSRRGDRAAVAPRATAWRVRLAPFALAATLVLLVGGAFVYRITGSSPRVLAAELTADHVKCFAMNAVLRTHQSASAVERSLASGFEWNMRLPASAERAGLELVGSRPCLYGKGKVAHIMYRHHGKPVSLFMLPRTTRPEQLIDVLGHQAAIWSAGDRTFVLIAREARSEVERLAAFVHAALK